MSKTLGIDLGTNSIGWAIVEKDNGTTVLIDKGVNIFQEGVAREKNVEKPQVQERTKARASRRHYFRRRLRKIELLKILVSERMCPHLDGEALHEWKTNKKYPMDDDFIGWLRTDDLSEDNPYADRYRCLTEKLNFDIQSDRYCFGRAMYHIVQRRGFLSNRKDASNESETGKVKTSISNLSGAMQESGCKYIGEYFYKLYRNPDKSSSKIRCKYTSRNGHYKAEFDRICQVQNIPDELKASLERAIFFQRPLKSQKGLVGKCTFEKNKPRCPLSHPRYEEFRMWQYINSIKIKGPEDEQLRILSEKEVELILPLFFRKSKTSFEFEEIEKKIAGKDNYGYLDDERQVPYRFNYREKSSVSGCPVLSGILAFIGKDIEYQNWDLNIASIYLKADGKSVDQIVNDLWHALFSFTDDDMLTKWLSTNFQAEEELARALAVKTKIPSGYASLSLKAISRILPFLKSGFRYDQAVLMAGVQNAFAPSRMKDDSLLPKAQKAICDELDSIDSGIVAVDAKKGKYAVLQELLRNDFSAEHPERMYHPSMIETYPQAIPDKNGIIKLGSPRVSSIKNPMAMRALFRLRALINELLVKGFIDKDTKINIEFARGLNNANVRKAIEAYQREREAKRAKYRALITEEYKGTGQDISPTDDDILKYQLWDEQQHICLYTGKEISIADFIGPNATYDIEHTVPRSRGGDNSDKNKTLCLNKFNRDVKKAKLPSELANHSDILARIDSLQWKKKISDLRVQIDCRRRDARSAETKEAKDNAIQRMHQARFELEYWQGKYERFTMNTVPEGFSNRQGVDIGIIGRYARLYLQSVFNRTYVVKGTTTADFRKAWGIQDEYEKKSRDSHSHHCVDAITIACIGKEEYDKWKTYAEWVDRYTFGDGPRPSFEKPWPTFSEDVKAVADEILVAHTTADNMGKQSKKRVRINGKLQYGAGGQKLYETGNTARGSLNKATFYGAIDFNGEIKYVVRKSIDSIQESDVKNIVDPVVQQKVAAAIAEKGFKNAISEPVWMNEEKRIPIKKVRLFTPTVTSPSILKKQRDLSDKEYKRNYYVTNDGNYCMAIYGNQTRKPSYKLYSNLDAARLFNSGAKSFIPESDNNGLPLSFVLKPGAMVLFYEKMPQEVYKCSYEELSKRLYKVTGLSSKVVSGKYPFGTIEFRHHLEARNKKELKSKNGLWKAGELYRPIIGLCHTQLKCLVENFDFRLGVDGKISFLHQ